ncbi:MAG: DUF2461 domain-containing protein [Bacteroidota bacterium]
MKTTPPNFDLELYPPFNGFPEEGIAFLRQLKKNNNREWFAKNKPRYEDYVKLPMQSLIAAIKPEMAKLAPEIEVNPKRNLFRIYRDTRFSKNKTPYKTHVAAWFHPKTKWDENAGFYVHVEPTEVYIGGGIYRPDNTQLKRIRHAIAGNAQEFLSIVGSASFNKKFGRIEGEKLQRMPLGFPQNHFMADWLKYKQFFAGVTLKPEDCLQSKFTKKVMNVFAELYPFVKFLNGAL